MQNDKNFRPDRIGAYFHIEWLPLALVTVSGLIYNIGLLATPWFEGRLAQCLTDILDGSATAAAMAMGREAHGEAVEGAVVTVEMARRQLGLLAPMPLAQRRQVPGLPPSRAEHMPHGLCILLSALRLCGMDRLTISGKTNLDGYLLEQAGAR